MNLSRLPEESDLNPEAGYVMGERLGVAGERTVERRNSRTMPFWLYYPTNWVGCLLELARRGLTID